MRQIFWLGGDTEVDVRGWADDCVRIEFNRANNDRGNHDLVLVGGRYQVHCLIIELDRQLSRFTDRYER